MYTTQNLLRIIFSTVRYFCVFVIHMKIDLKELNIISLELTFMKIFIMTMELFLDIFIVNDCKFSYM